MVECSWNILFTLACLIAVAIILIPYIFTSIPMYNEHYCVGGQVLSDKEQMWCTPKKKVDVTASGKCSSLSLYRLKKSQVPETIIIPSSYIHDFDLAPKTSRSYSFEVMPGSNVSFTFGSTDKSDDCYVMTHDNLNSFIDNKKFSYIKTAKGSLSMAFTESEGLGYSLVIDHASGSATASFNLSIDYVIYNTSSLDPIQCKYKKDDCELEDVTSNEVIIASNGDGSTCLVQLKLPETFGTGAILSRIVGPVILIVSGLTMFIVGMVSYLQARRRHKMLVDALDQLNRLEAEKRRQSQPTEYSPLVNDN